jgi:hypothetical protein
MSNSKAEHLNDCCDEHLKELSSALRMHCTSGPRRVSNQTALLTCDDNNGMDLKE